MIDALILLAILVVLVALVIITGRWGGRGITGPDDRRHDGPPNPGREGR